MNIDKKDDIVEEIDDIVDEKDEKVDEIYNENMMPFRPFHSDIYYLILKLEEFMKKKEN